MTDNINYLLSAGHRPFSDPDAAAIKASVLTRETGYAFSVCPHPDGGYAVINTDDALAHGIETVREGEMPQRPVRTPVNSDALTGNEDIHPLLDIASHTPKLDIPLQTDKKTTAPKEDQEPYRDKRDITTPKQEAVYRPAYKAYLTYIIAGTAGAIIMLFPDMVWPVLQSLNFSQAYTGMGLVVNTLAIFLILYGFGTTGVQMASSSYRVTKKGVESNKGLISRETNTIPFQNILTVEVKQGIIDRILKIGTVKFASAGTNDAEVVFEKVDNPLAISELVSECIGE